jgi:hypothetical protein
VDLSRTVILTDPLSDLLGHLPAHVAFDKNGKKLPEKVVIDQLPLAFQDVTNVCV